VKWILKYLRGTTKRCLGFGNGKSILEAYIIADMVDDVDERKSTFGYVTIFAWGGGVLIHGNQSLKSVLPY